jgi:hypothetical protein
MLFWAVGSDLTGEAVELFTRREEAEAIVQARDVDEPEQVGALRVERVKFESSLKSPRRVPRVPTFRSP